MEEDLGRYSSDAPPFLADAGCRFLADADAGFLSRWQHPAMCVEEEGWRKK
jgi:hypothetical protein